MNVTDIFSVPKQRIKAQTGRLLISEPFMQDPYFKRAVIFITEHNEKGSFGLIINKPIPMYLNEAIENAPVFDSKLGLGGPVQNETLYYLHLKGDLIPNSVEVIDGVYWGGDFETIKKMMLANELQPNDIRLFVGYAGWGEGQLKSEMDTKSWIVAKADKDLLFSKKPETLWSDILNTMGQPYSYMVNLPEDPRLN
ncbi:MAG: YqgE/AlgH family protein [Flavobacteriales bacterium]|nr:YqgE/AlgH family protein [Flavobacteriales bacterium]